MGCARGGSGIKNDSSPGSRGNVMMMSSQDWKDEHVRDNSATAGSIELMQCIHRNLLEARRMHMPAFFDLCKFNMMADWPLLSMYLSRQYLGKVLEILLTGQHVSVCSSNAVFSYCCPVNVARPCEACYRAENFYHCCVVFAV